MDYKSIFITGGAGYVGSCLVPRLLEKGYRVTVYDLFIYDYKFPEHPHLRQVRADIRDRKRLMEESRNADAFIHLACISNDPSFDLDPELGRSINYDAFPNIINAVRHGKSRLLLLASSTSQYGVKPADMEVTEESEHEPITDYARYKYECEKLCRSSGLGGKAYAFVRPATLCGYAPRLRLDLSVNILTINALVSRKIRIFGGEQIRPALHILDMARFYELLLETPAGKISGEAFNVSHKNISIRELAELVKKTLGDSSIEFEVTPTDDRRSYHVNTDKMKRVLGFSTEYTFEDAILSIKEAYEKGLIKDALDNPLYYNIKRMKEIGLK